MIINPQTGNATFEMDQIEPAVFYSIKGLAPGEYADVAQFQERDGTIGYRIIYLKSETKPHKANLHDDYHRIQAVALTKKQDDALQKWLEDKIAMTYIRIDPIYHECKEIEKWIKTP